MNYTPVPYPDFTPAVLTAKAGQRQLWRVLNASADTILDLALEYDGVPQPLAIVAPGWRSNRLARWYLQRQDRAQEACTSSTCIARRVYYHRTFS